MKELKWVESYWFKNSFVLSAPFDTIYIKQKEAVFEVYIDEDDIMTETESLEEAKEFAYNYLVRIRDELNKLLEGE